MNTSIETPDALPLLSVGNHEPGSGKACIMDAVSIISGHADDLDHPRVVAEVLRPVFMYINDTCVDSERHRLWEPALHAIGTPITDPNRRHKVAVALAVWCARRVLRGQPAVEHPEGSRALSAATAWCAAPGRDTRIAALLAANRICRDTHWNGCHGCRYAGMAADAVRNEPQAAAALHQAVERLGRTEDRLAFLDALLEEYTRLTASRPDVAPAPTVAWDELRGALGASVPAG